MEKLYIFNGIYLLKKDGLCQEPGIRDKNPRLPRDPTLMQCFYSGVVYDVEMEELAGFMWDNKASYLLSNIKLTADQFSFTATRFKDSFKARLRFGIRENGLWLGEYLSDKSSGWSQCLLTEVGPSFIDPSRLLELFP